MTHYPRNGVVMRKRFWLGKHLMLKRRFVDKILSGEKATTIRLGKVGIRSREFYIHAGGRIVARAVVEGIAYKRVKELTDEDAKADGFSSVLELKEELKRFYPNIKEHDWVTIIRFRVVERIDKAETHVYGGLSAYEVAKKALEYSEQLSLDDEEIKVLRKIVETGSIRAAARELYGHPLKRRRIRRILWNVVKKLCEKGFLDKQSCRH